MDDLKQRIDAAQRETARRAESHPNAQPLIPEVHAEGTQGHEELLPEEALAELLDSQLSTIRDVLEGRNPDVNADNVFERALTTLGTRIATAQDGQNTPLARMTCELFSTLRSLSKKYTFSANNARKLEQHETIMLRPGETRTTIITKALQSLRGTFGPDRA